jgi:uncharacterized lipoprotein YddW (UPF0748 family)
MKYLQVVSVVIGLSVILSNAAFAAIPHEKGRLSIAEKKEDERIGLWIEAEGENRPLSDRKEFNRLISKLTKYPFTDIYVQLYRHGRSWYPTLSADSAPFIENKEKGFYPIGELLSFASKRGIRVHAWLNVLRLGENPEVPLLQRAGMDASLVDCRGQSLAENKGMGTVGARPDTPGIWLDPSHAEVVTSIVSVIHDLVSEYPSLSGIHLDMIRTTFPYGGGSWGGEPTLCKEFYTKREYEQLSAKRGLLSSSLVRSIFGQVPKEVSKTEGVTNIVRNIRQYLDWHAPQMELSAAVLSNQRKAKNYAHQDWPKWVSTGLIDTAILMNYTTDSSQFYSESKEGISESSQVSLGLGAWLGRNNTALVREQVRKIKSLKKKGLVLFSYSNLADSKGDRVLDAIFEEVKK